ncbi:DUF421 domain-containing protein [Clostridium sp. A1-XYC3]|uniref:DUF421 domain-containing protein n=1 Tax=Clostridium tanneri TaxID=3037988 RepID=A0ABU4JVX5_9CLOT|nr:DUF421 domain-containing protein [Clostridium sp. A1-XYC3]MDW8802310.1 DUF421 domain-containing protein [Clostridium sp. A1-XYC3]
MKDVLAYSIRVILVYFFTYLCSRILTKKAISEMTAYEVAGVMILANVAAEPLVDKVVLKSVFGSGVLVLLMSITSRLAMINRLTPVLEHTATIVIKNGQIDKAALNRLSLSLNQLEGLLREKGFDKVSEVETAIIEPQGTLSAFPKEQNRPVQLKDLNIESSTKSLTIPLVMDGSIIMPNLKHIGRSKEWIIGEMKKQGINNYKEEVFLAELDSSLNLSILKK